MSSRLRPGLVLCFAVIAVAGCRDMVVPEQDIAAPDVIYLNVVGLGSDAILEGAIVTLDNRAYVSGATAGEWTAETELGYASFVELPAGTFDLDVQPSYPSSTPPWSSTAVLITGPESTVAIEGIPLQLLLDWPQLEVLGVEPDDIEVTFYYKLYDPDRGTYGTSQLATWVSDGHYAGSLPWTGSYPARVDASYGNFSLRYDVPDAVQIDGTTPVALASPLHLQPITLEAGGETMTSGSVEIVHRVTGPPGFHDYYLRYDFVPSGAADSLYLMPPAVSELIVRWREGHAFLPQYRYLSEEQMVPGTINLGAFLADLQARDADGQSVPSAQFEIFNERSSFAWRTGPDGVLEILLNGDSYLVKASASGYQTLSTVLEVTADASHVFQLEAE